MILSKRANNHKQPKTWRLCALFLPHLAVSTSTTTLVSTIHLLEPLAQEIFVITGNFPKDVIDSDKIHLINIGVKPEGNARSPMLIRILKFIILQLKISYSLIKVSSKVDLVFLAAGAQVLLLPMLSAKLLRKKTILLHLGVGASSRKDYEVLFAKALFGMGKYVLPWFTEFLEKLNFRLADRMAVFLSRSSSPHLERYGNKILFGCSRFYVDTAFFKVERDLNSRENLVGYVGQLIDMKGVMNLVKAIPLMPGELAISGFVIGGDGLQRNAIESEIKNANLGDRVNLRGWIPHDKLPQYLNELKLLVIPSYGETGPHLLFEAMACGTPVLAAPVGVMPEVIKDGENGFIMEDNSPECIARNITRALNHANLDKIAKNARKLMEKEYTHEAAVERYRHVLASLE